MRKSKKKAIEANIALEDFALDNEFVSEDFALEKGLPMDDDNMERDYFAEYYKAYKNDYISQYLDAYKSLKNRQAKNADELSEENE